MQSKGTNSKDFELGLPWKNSRVGQSHHLHTVVAFFAGSAHYGETMEQCSCHLEECSPGVTAIEEYSRGVDVHYEFISWELHGTFLILIVAGLNLP